MIKKWREWWSRHRSTTWREPWKWTVKQQAIGVGVLAVASAMVAALFDTVWANDAVREMAGGMFAAAAIGGVLLVVEEGREARREARQESLAAEQSATAHAIAVADIRDRRLTEVWEALEKVSQQAITAAASRSVENAVQMMALVTEVGFAIVRLGDNELAKAWHESAGDDELHTTFFLEVLEDDGTLKPEPYVDYLSAIQSGANVALSHMARFYDFELPE